MQEKPGRPVSALQKLPGWLSVVFIWSCCVQKLVILDGLYGYIGGQRGHLLQRNSFSDGFREVRRIVENVDVIFCDFERNVKDSQKFRIFNFSVGRNVDPQCACRAKKRAYKHMLIVSYSEYDVYIANAAIAPPSECPAQPTSHRRYPSKMEAVTPVETAVKTAVLTAVTTAIMTGVEAGMTAVTAAASTAWNERAENPS